MADYDLQYQDNYIDVLLATANELKTAGYIYKGVATPSTNPGTPTERVAYLASEPGTYTNFGGIVIASGLYSLTYDGGTWTGTQMSAGSDIEVVQATGDSTTDVMSQKAVTDEIDIIKKGVEIVSYSSYLRNQQALGSNGNWRTGLADMVSAVIPCKANALYRIENVGATYTRYAFFKNNSLTNNQPAPFCSGYSGNGTYLEQGDIVTITSPSDAKYLYVVINNHNVDSHINIEQVSEFYNYIKDNFVQGVNVENDAQVISLAGNGTTAVVSGYIPVLPNTPYTLVSSLKTWTMPSSISANTGFRVSEHETNSGNAVWTDVRYTLEQIETDGLPDKMHFTTKHLTNYVRFTIIAPVGTIINLTLAESIDLQDINETLSRDEKTQQNVVGTYSGEKIVLNSLQTYNKFQFMQFNEEKLIFQSMDFCSVSGTDYGIFILKPYDAETPYGWIYNMSRRLKMQDITFPIPSGYSLCHANTSFFLKDKYSESSVLPMFAINMWQLEKVVFIYDFIEETVTDELLNTYTQIKPVLRYTIEPDSSIRNLGTYIDFINDND